jgi:hypothetical protein
VPSHAHVNSSTATTAHTATASSAPANIPAVNTPSALSTTTLSALVTSARTAHLAAPGASTSTQKETKAMTQAMTHEYAGFFHSLRFYLLANSLVARNPCKG